MTESKPEAENLEIIADKLAGISSKEPAANLDIIRDWAESSPGGGDAHKIPALTD
jgi:hypothetical protein